MDDALVVVTTLLTVGLCNPLRRSIQTMIDRRFYRSKFDSARTLAAFGATLRTETDLSALSERLVMAVQETMQPAQVSLWLRPLDRWTQHVRQSGVERSRNALRIPGQTAQLYSSAPWTTSPPTSVAATSAPASRSAGSVKGFSASATRSASLPGMSDP